jgi:hypothetical protein
MPSKLTSPIDNLLLRRVNNTLHGRSVYRSEDVPGHNVFRGYSTWEGNGHKGVGDGLDLFAVAKTPVYAIGDCTQTLWRNDASRLEVIYLEGSNWIAVYAHINAAHEGTGIQLKSGDIVGYIRGDLSDPHLHFELWVDGKAVSAPTAKILQTKVAAFVQAPIIPPPTTKQVWNFSGGAPIKEANGDITCTGMATQFDDHVTRTGIPADRIGVMGCALPRGLCAATKGSGFEGVLDRTLVRVYNIRTKKTAYCIVIDEGPAWVAQAGTGKPGAAMIDLNPGVAKVLGMSPGQNDQVDIRVFTGSNSIVTTLMNGVYN